MVYQMNYDPWCGKYYWDIYPVTHLHESTFWLQRERNIKREWNLLFKVREGWIRLFGIKFGLMYQGLIHIYRYISLKLLRR